MNNQRILWFQDGVKLKIPWNHWNDIDRLTRTLISKVGQPDFEHVVVDPLECMNNLRPKLNDQKFSCIIDLSGFIGKKIVKEFSMPILDAIHLSRLRVITSPKLDGAGHLVNLKPKEVSVATSSLDLSHPLILDDVSWSGRTIIEAIKLLKVGPTTVTAGLLTINKGNFGEKPGAFKLLMEKGVSVLSGKSVDTPIDDGFHLADFFDHPSVEDIFDKVIHLQILREEAFRTIGDERRKIEQKIKIFLRENQRDFFPNALSDEEVKLAEEEGRLVGSSGISKDDFFTTNPLNWFLPSFSKRINSDLLISNREDITNILKAFKEISDGNTETTWETKPQHFTERSSRGIEVF